MYGSTETGGIASRNAADADFKLSPPDHLAWSGDRTFRIGGRVDTAVQVGGHNVYPRHVAARLREHPAVETAAVRLMTPAEGDRLKAFVVPRWGGPARIC